MSDVAKRLAAASATYREGSPVEVDLELIRDALNYIHQLETSKRQLERWRFDRYFVAALQGVIARSTASDLVRGRQAIVDEARRFAELSIQMVPGGDSQE